jgi:polysaccharide deacetylase family protein (PEP-CTERM system associated)
MIRHVLTIDLEDWFHCLEPDPARWGGFPRRVEATTHRMLDLLDEHAAMATFFVLGDVARHAPALVRTIAARGHEIGSHGSEHRMVTQLSPARFRADLDASLGQLADLTGAPVRAFRAPYFSITKRTLWALDILCEHGIEHDSSIFPVRNPRYGIPDAETTPHQIRPSLVEWPISVLATRFGNVPFAGGVYFRWLPFAIVQKGFAALESRRQPVIFYLHPWELDPEQPWQLTGPFLFARHYAGLRGTEPRLRRLLTDHRFGTLAAAASVRGLA